VLSAAPFHGSRSCPADPARRACAECRVVGDETFLDGFGRCEACAALFCTCGARLDRIDDLTTDTTCGNCCAREALETEGRAAYSLALVARDYVRAHATGSTDVAAIIAGDMTAAASAFDAAVNVRAAAMLGDPRGSVDARNIRESRTVNDQTNAPSAERKAAR
jgi:hypothetical protein